MDAHFAVSFQANTSIAHAKREYRSDQKPQQGINVALTTLCQKIISH